MWHNFVLIPSFLEQQALIVLITITYLLIYTTNNISAAEYKNIDHHQNQIIKGSSISHEQCSIISSKSSTINNLTNETSSSTVRFLIPTSSEGIPLKFDEPITIEPDKLGMSHRFFFELHEPTPLSIKFSQNSIKRKLYFNQSLNFLINSTKISIPCAPIGRYDLLICPSLETTSDRKSSTTNSTFSQTNFIPTTSKIPFILYATKKHIYSNWTFLDYVEPSRIRYENRLKKQQMILKWTQSKLDIHAVKYCISINTKKNQPTLCEAFRNSLGYSKQLFFSLLNITENFFRRPAHKTVTLKTDGVTIICTGKKSRQIFRKLQPNQQYFIDIFGIHSELENLPFLLKSTSIWFNRTRAIQIEQNQMIKTKLSEFGGQSVFSFKVPILTGKNKNKSILNTKIQIIPCGKTLTVKLFKYKILKSIQDLYKPMIIKMENINELDRLNIKISLARRHEIGRNNKFAISVTTDDVFSQIPQLPNITTVYHIISRCRSIKIAWYPSPDSRQIRYCVYLLKMPIQQNSLIDTPSSNLCDPNMITKENYPNLKRTKCFEPKEPRTSVVELSFDNLSVGTCYLVQVMVHLKNISMPYDQLNVCTNECCYDIYNINDIQKNGNSDNNDEDGDADADTHDNDDDYGTSFIDATTDQT